MIILSSNSQLFAGPPLNKKSGSLWPNLSACSLFFPGFSEPFLPVGPPCSCDVVLIKALLSCCDSSDIVY